MVRYALEPSFRAAIRSLSFTARRGFLTRLRARHYEEKGNYGVKAEHHQVHQSLDRRLRTVY